MSKLIKLFLVAGLCALFFSACASDGKTSGDTVTKADSESVTETEAATEAEVTTEAVTTAEPETEPETEPEKTVVVKQFTFTDAANLGWKAANQVSDLRSEDNLLKFTCTGGDPFIQLSTQLGIDASEIDVIKIKVLNMTESYDCQLFFDTDKVAGFSEDKSYKYMYDYGYSDPTSDEWNIVEIYTADCDLWDGLIKNIRFDPSTAVGDIAIEYISFEKFDDAQ
jgi:hypothetical protein